MRKNILITSALPYINNFPHMGHIVGCHLPADIFFRFNKQVGNNPIFIGGSDEHGTAALISAKSAGVSAKEFVDKLSAVHKAIYDKLDISYDIYSGTSTPIHKEVTYDFFNELKKNGLIEQRSAMMPYCEKDNVFLADRFIEGTCPVCGYEHAYGDQCDKCGSCYESDKLIAPKCKFCGETPKLKETKHFYYCLDKVEGELKAWIESKKDIFRPHVYAEAMRWIKEGLKPRCITRDIPWGIPIKVGDDEKVFYVWFEAPIGYISFVKQLGGDKLLDEYWKNTDTEIYNFIGKDNIPFHSVFFPAMLIGAKKYNLPYNVVGLNFMNYEGQKFSKSKGIGVFCNPLLDSDIDIDGLRAYLTTCLPETKDSDFKWEGLRDNTNSELVGKFGNFFNRSLNMIQKNFNGQLDYTLDETTLNDEDKIMIDAIKTYPNKIKELFEKVELREAYKQIMAFSSIGNVYIEKSAPWSLIKNGQIDDAKKVLYLSLCMAKNLSILAYPIIPKKAQSIYEQLGFVGNVGESDIYAQTGKIDIEKTHKINAPMPLFERIDDDKLAGYRQHFSKVVDVKDIG